MATPRQTIQLRQEHARLQRLRCPLLSLSRWGKLAVCQSAMALRGKRGASAAVQQVIPACSQALNKRRPLPERRVSSRAGGRATRQADWGLHSGLPTFCAAAQRCAHCSSNHAANLGNLKTEPRNRNWDRLASGMPIQNTYRILRPGHKAHPVWPIPARSLDATCLGTEWREPWT